ncbi:hypothetical protein HYR54_12055 [Candidatus Acetothermia bacterium]|nr:hypothetical protein [Candidatus Acetothermia bacterium]
MDERLFVRIIFGDDALEKIAKGLVTMGIENTGLSKLTGTIMLLAAPLAERLTMINNPIVCMNLTRIWPSLQLVTYISLEG